MKPTSLFLLGLTYFLQGVAAIFTSLHRLQYTV